MKWISLLLLLLVSSQSMAQILQFDLNIKHKKGDYTRDSMAKINAKLGTEFTVGSATDTDTYTVVITRTGGEERGGVKFTLNNGDDYSDLINFNCKEDKDYSNPTINRE